MFDTLGSLQCYQADKMKFLQTAEHGLDRRLADDLSSQAQLSGLWYLDASVLRFICDIGLALVTPMSEKYLSRWK